MVKLNKIFEKFWKMIMIFIKIISRKFVNLTFKTIFYNIFLEIETITNYINFKLYFKLD